MDILSGLIPYLQGLFVSTLAIIQIMLGSGHSVLSSFVAYESPQAQMPITSTPLNSATTTEVKKAAVATTTPKLALEKKIAASLPVSKPTAPKVSSTPLLTSDAVNTAARASIVNILCLAASDTGLHSISGSGVIIDARGVILTNAHIGQYFLLKDGFHTDSVDCTIRTGSPATSLYRATLLYLPPQWIDVNAKQIDAEHAVGTGEYDYAFLLINSTTNPQATLPSSFPNIGMSASAPDTGDEMLVAGYPAGFLDGMTIEKSLYATSAFTQIGKLYTFDAPSTVDVVSLGGTVVAQGGSSGGAVVRTYDGMLTGLITTSTTGDTTAERDLRAITLNYINRSLSSEGKGGIAGFLTNDLAKTAQDFNANVAPKEKQELLDAVK